jgi:hypothetical protein
MKKRLAEGMNAAEDEKQNEDEEMVDGILIIILSITE